MQKLFEKLPVGYEARYSELELIRHAFYQQMAIALEQPLNEFAAAQRQHSSEERRELAAGINSQLRRLGLAIRSTVSDKPARLVVDTEGAGDGEKTRFRFGIRGPGGGPRNQGYFKELPYLELMEAEPRVEGLSTEFKRRGRNGRSR